MRGVQKCTRGCSTLRGRKRLPLCCIKLDTATDPACGTGGMLTVAEEYLRSQNSNAQLICFGQEINAQTYAICKSDILIKGANADHIKEGNTLSNDHFKDDKFDYIMSNPPFGREWKNEKAKGRKRAKIGIRWKIWPWASFHQ